MKTFLVILLVVMIAIALLFFTFISSVGVSFACLAITYAMFPDEILEILNKHRSILETRSKDQIKELVSEIAKVMAKAAEETRNMKAEH